MSILARADFGLLAALCIEWEVYITAEQFLRENGRYYTVRDEDGKIKFANIVPMETIKQRAFDKYAELCREFGLSPVARTRIAVDKKEQTVSRMAQMLKKAV